MDYFIFIKFLVRTIHQYSVRVEYEGIAFPFPEQQIGTVEEIQILCLGVQNRCFGRGNAILSLL